MPKEDLTPYAGHWVALRDGYVIASALDAVTLRAQPEIHEDDVLIPVRRHGTDVNVLQGHAITGGEPGLARTSPGFRSDWPTDWPISPEAQHPRGLSPMYHI